MVRANVLNCTRCGKKYPVEVDECYVGGETRGEGRGTHHKSIVVGAVEVRPRVEDGKTHRRRVYAGRLRLRVVPDRSAEALTSFVKDSVVPGSIVRTDAWGGYPTLSKAGYRHDSLERYPNAGNRLGGFPNRLSSDS